MPSDTVVAPTPSQSNGRFPRAAWIGAGLIGLVGAALAGALVMRSVDAPAAPPAQPLAANTATGLPVGQPVPPDSSAPEAAPLHGLAGQPVPLNDGSAPPAPQAVPVPVPVPAPKTSTTARAVSPAPAPAPTVARAAVCRSCGVVESVSTVSEKGQGTGVGAVAGGVLGGVVGHQVGGGHGKTALTVLGAVGGVLAGNEVEKRVRATTHYDVHVRMADGSYRTFRRDSALAVGARVVVEGSTLRLQHSNG